MVGSRAIATVGINGQDVPMLVDSGAWFFSFLTEATAAQLKLRACRCHVAGMEIYGLVGSVDAYVTTVERLELVKGELNDVQFIVGGNEPGEGTMGLMGRNILGFADVEFDLAHGAIRFVLSGQRSARRRTWPTGPARRPVLGGRTAARDPRPVERRRPSSHRRSC